MPETLILPDLDVMDVAALKALARAQHKQSQEQQDLIKAQQEQYLASLSSRASEIAHLKLLLDRTNEASARRPGGHAYTLTVVSSR